MNDEKRVSMPIAEYERLVKLQAVLNDLSSELAEAVSMLEDVQRRVESGTINGDEVYYYSTKGVLAKGHPQGRKRFLILAGSQASGSCAESMPDRAYKERRRLREQGKLKPMDGSWDLEFIEDVLCPSASFAANLVSGNSRSGNETWRSLDGKYLKDVD